MLAKTKTKALLTPKGDHITLNQLVSKGVKSTSYERWELALISRVAEKPISREKYPMLYERGKGRVYTDDIPSQMIKYFSRSVAGKTFKPGKNQKVYSKTLFPMHERFAWEIGTRADVLEKWYDVCLEKNVRLEYVDAYKQSKLLQLANIGEGGMLGVYSGSFSQFIVKNITDWKDKQEVSIEGSLSHSHKQVQDLSRLTIKELQELQEKVKNGESTLSLETSDGISDTILLNSETDFDFVDNNQEEDEVLEEEDDEI